MPKHVGIELLRLCIFTECWSNKDVIFKKRMVKTHYKVLEYRLYIILYINGTTGLLSFIVRISYVILERYYSLQMPHQMDISLVYCGDTDDRKVCFFVETIEFSFLSRDPKAVVSNWRRKYLSYEKHSSS